jgi:hypothetical protein
VSADVAWTADARTAGDARGQRKLTERMPAVHQAGGTAPTLQGSPLIGTDNGAPAGAVLGGKPLAPTTAAEGSSSTLTARPPTTSFRRKRDEEAAVICIQAHWRGHRVLLGAVMRKVDTIMLANARGVELVRAIGSKTGAERVFKVTQLLKLGASLRVADERGMTALHRACSLPMLDDGETAWTAAMLTRLLLRHGAPVNIRTAATNGMSQTPAMHSAAHCQLHALKLLCKAGADVTLADGYSRTALDHANTASKSKDPARARTGAVCVRMLELWLRRDDVDADGVRHIALHAQCAVGALDAASSMLAGGQLLEEARLPTDIWRSGSHAELLVKAGMVTDDDRARNLMWAKGATAREVLEHYVTQPLVELYGGCMVALKVS